MKRTQKAGCAAVVLLACVTLTGCRESRVVRTDYFPMRDGNRWEYRLLDHGRLKVLAAGGSVPTADKISMGQDMGGDAPGETVEPKADVVGEESKAPAAETRPARRIELALKEAADEITYRSTYDGFEQVWTKRGGYIGFQNARGRHYLLILPPHSGYRWIVTDAGGQNLYFEVEGHQDVETPAGKFRECAVARQESRDKREIFRLWFAPDVGLVRRSKYYLDEEVFRQELVEYQIRASLPAGRDAEEREIQQAFKGKNRGTEHRVRSTTPDPNRFAAPPIEK